MTDADKAPAPPGLDHLGIEQLGVEASSAAWALGLWPGGAPVAPSGRNGSAARQIFLQPVCQEQRDAPGASTCTT